MGQVGETVWVSADDVPPEPDVVVSDRSSAQSASRYYFDSHGGLTDETRLIIYCTRNGVE
jgi:hypothetical protein